MRCRAPLDPILDLDTGRTSGRSPCVETSRAELSHLERNKTGAEVSLEADPWYPKKAGRRGIAKSCGSA